MLELGLEGRIGFSQVGRKGGHFIQGNSLLATVALHVSRISLPFALFHRSCKHAWGLKNGPCSPLVFYRQAHLATPVSVLRTVGWKSGPSVLPDATQRTSVVPRAPSFSSDLLSLPESNIFLPFMLCCAKHSLFLSPPFLFSAGLFAFRRTLSRGADL